MTSKNISLWFTPVGERKLVTVANRRCKLKCFRDSRTHPFCAGGGSRTTSGPKVALKDAPTEPTTATGPNTATMEKRLAQKERGKKTFLHSFIMEKEQDKTIFRLPIDQCGHRKFNIFCEIASVSKVTQWVIFLAQSSVQVVFSLTVPCTYFRCIWNVVLTTTLCFMVSVYERICSLSRAKEWINMQECWVSKLKNNFINTGITIRHRESIFGALIRPKIWVKLHFPQIYVMRVWRLIHKGILTVFLSVDIFSVETSRKIEITIKKSVGTQKEFIPAFPLTNHLKSQPPKFSFNLSDPLSQDVRKNYRDLKFKINHPNLLPWLVAEDSDAAIGWRSRPSTLEKVRFRGNIFAKSAWFFLKLFFSAAGVKQEGCLTSFNAFYLKKKNT